MPKKSQSFKPRAALIALRDPAPTDFYNQEVFVVLDWASGSFRWTTDPSEIKHWEYVIMLPKNRKFANVKKDEDPFLPEFLHNWIKKQFNHRLVALEENYPDFVADVTAMKDR